MKKTVSACKRYLRKAYNSRLSLILQSILTGLIIGLVVALFRIIIIKTQVWRAALYEYLKTASIDKTILWIVILIVVGLLLGILLKICPMTAGSGIPHIKSYLNKKSKLHWQSELPVKWITSIIVISAGMSLGYQGPCVQIGALTSLAVLSLFKRGNASRHTLVCAGSAAGLSAAFGAPLAGVLFVIEELQTSVHPLFVACAMGAAVAADVAAGLFIGLDPVFNFKFMQVLPNSSFPWIILLGVICALLGDMYKRLLYSGQNLCAFIPKILRPVLPLLASVPIGFFFFNVTGSGYSLIESLTNEYKPLTLLIALLVIKMLFTGLSFGSGSSGGIFMPFLACGALTGTIFSAVLIHMGLITNEQSFTFIMLGMAGYFAAVVKEPVTAIVLILEMTANMNHMISLVCVTFSAFVVSELIISRPVYTVLMEKWEKNRAA
jgi:H+/Cl- antiporter ClcA